MSYNTNFGPAGQTAEQRAWVLAQMQTIISSLQTEATPAVQALYAQYVAGELSWLEMRQALDAALFK